MPIYPAGTSAGGGGGTVVQSVVEVTTTVDEINFVLDTNASFHRFEYFFETETASSQFAMTCNDDITLGNYSFQSNGVYNGGAILGEDTTENLCNLNDQSVVNKNVSGVVNIRGVSNRGLAGYKLIHSTALNLVTTTAFEMIDRMFNYEVSGDIINVTFGMRQFLLSATDGNGLVSGKIVYSTINEG